MVLLVPMLAQAEPVQVIVRQGAGDATVVQRVRGQLADLDDVVLEIDEGEPEPTLEAQLATAERLEARVVVWFTMRGKNVVVAVATPREHRVFVREIPAAAESAMAEAAAIAVRSAVRAISLGGTIGVEVKAPEPDPIVAEPIVVATPETAISASLGWQLALDGGAARGAHALAQRTTIARGAWAASLSLTLGAPLEWRAADDVALDVSRSGALLGAERRLEGGFAVGIGAGTLLYHRSTSTTPSGLTPTPSNTTFAFAATVEAAWHAKLTRHVGFVAAIGVDVVAGAPEAALSRNGMVEIVDAIRPVQPRASLALEVGSW